MLGLSTNANAEKPKDKNEKQPEDGEVVIELGWMAPIEHLVSHCRKTKNALAVVVTNNAKHDIEFGIAADLGSAAFDLSQRKRTSGYHPFFWLPCEAGGHSQVLILGANNESEVASRIRGIEPSYVMIASKEMMTEGIRNILTAHLGRRQGSESHVYDYIPPFRA